MYGRDLRAILEENASERLTVRMLRGQAYFFAKNDLFTNIICGGVSFVYDMGQPEGERVAISGFASGRAYDPDALYLVAVNNYLLGNERCGLRRYSDEDALWSQLTDNRGGTIQDSIQEYIADLTEKDGGVSPELFSWEWRICCSADPTALPACEGTVAATLADAPEDGRRYVLYQEAQGCTLTARASSGGLDITEISAYGDVLVDELPEDALIFTAHPAEGRLMLTDQQGRYFTCGASGGLSLTEEPAENDLSLWELIPAEGGFYVKSVGARNNQALEYYGGKITTYWLSSSGLYLFNFYEVASAE